MTRQLVRWGVLIRRGGDAYWFAVPGIGLFLKELVRGRRELVSAVRRNKHKEVLRKVGFFGGIFIAGPPLFIPPDLLTSTLLTRFLHSSLLQKLETRRLRYTSLDTRFLIHDCIGHGLLTPVDTAVGELLQIGNVEVPKTAV